MAESYIPAYRTHAHNYLLHWTTAQMVHEPTPNATGASLHRPLLEITELHDGWLEQ